MYHRHKKIGLPSKKSELPSHARPRVVAPKKKSFDVHAQLQGQLISASSRIMPRSIICQTQNENMSLRPRFEKNNCLHMHAHVQLEPVCCFSRVHRYKTMSKTTHAVHTWQRAEDVPRQFWSRADHLAPALWVLWHESWKWTRTHCDYVLRHARTLELIEAFDKQDPTQDEKTRTARFVDYRQWRFWF